MRHRIDAREMSESYGNTIPLFGTSTELKKLIKRMKTDATPVEEPKDPDSSSVFLTYENFATPEKTTELRQQLKAGGMGWGHLKEIAFTELDEQLTPMRERYNALMEPDSELNDTLAEGATRARDRAVPLLRATRRAIGI
jgi:tryptophanyl-tRNA synthetase